MEIFSRFNKRNIQDRQIDTLIGLSKGIIANGNVDQTEAEFLQTWLVQNCETDNPIVLNLLNKVSVLLDDGILDDEEASDLFSILHRISGEATELGEVAKTTGLPLCSPAPNITFTERNFLFTGTCVYGTRKECQEAVLELGGLNVPSVTKKLNYLVLGTYVTESWAHENFGRKIEKAMKYRDAGSPISIISEQHWIEESGL